MQADIETFIREIKALGYRVKIDTNGSYTEKLKHLVEEHLVDYVAMDIKNSLGRYGQTIGVEGYDTAQIQQSVEYLMSGAVPFEFRTTVVKEFHKKEDFADIGRWIKGGERYFLQNFEDSGDLIQQGLHGYIPEIMNQAADIVKKNVPNVELRGVK